jgi:hypothetical protein
MKKMLAGLGLVVPAFLLTAASLALPNVATILIGLLFGGFALELLIFTIPAAVAVFFVTGELQPAVLTLL